MDILIQINESLETLRRSAAHIEERINDLLGSRAKIVCSFKIGDTVIYMRPNLTTFLGAHKTPVRYAPIRVKITDITGHKLKPYYELVAQYVLEDGILDGRLKIYWYDVHKVEMIQ